MKYILGLVLLLWIAGVSAVVITTIELQINREYKLRYIVPLIFFEVYLLVIVPMAFMSPR